MEADKKSLCKWKNSNIKDDSKEFRKLVKNAKFFCRKCGRSARRKSNLCKPEAI